jgi:hypothetical protein
LDSTLAEEFDEVANNEVNRAQICLDGGIDFAGIDVRRL